MYIYSDTAAEMLFVESSSELGNYSINDSQGNCVPCQLLKGGQCGDVWKYAFDASSLEKWSPSNPKLYTFTGCGETVRFGYSTLRPFQNKELLLNGKPVFLRGYIRGIVAHDHPNMTGGSLYDAARKNISQAKKYGFNLVRFHSTIPTEDFVRAADELGLLIHMEIGFAYEYDSAGNKKNLSVDNTAWRDTILRYRNHPSVAIFCIGNELHKSGHFSQVRVMYEEGRRLAPNKLIMDNSGWGEYDRSTADVYSQHIAYFFPFKGHRDMFMEDKPWRINGAVSDEPLEASRDCGMVHADARRMATPIRPVLAHEAIHYIDIPDYKALSKKFDDFAAKVGPEYLAANGINKPRFMTELPILIKRKGLESKMADYIAGSSQFKMQCVKTYLERLRLSNLCGYEMLQFSDCMKYENKNGIVDCFDDDKYIPADWMLQFNGDLVLLADFEQETHYYGEPVKVRIAVSDFLAEAEIRGNLKVTLGGNVVYTGADFALPGGVQTLVDLTLTVKDGERSKALELVAEFTSGGNVWSNQWKLWFYPKRKPLACPELQLAAHPKLKTWLESIEGQGNAVLADSLNEDVFAKLEAGRTVVLLYEYGAKRNAWQFPGALERFKPCIWDRGSNLGGIISSKVLENTLANGRYFDLNLQPLLEAGSKVNLDHFPCQVTEHVNGIDKPVRDRMKGLIQHIKDFIDDDTLRNFSHLFSLKVGNGQLIVCSFNLNEPEGPVAANLLCQLLDNTDAFFSGNAIALDEFKSWLVKTNEAGFQPEDVMNHFWEIDNKPVEDTLFWEEAGIDLSKLKE